MATQKTTFKRDEKTGKMIAYRGGKKVDSVGGLGDGPMRKTGIKRPKNKK